MDELDRQRLTEVADIIETALKAVEDDDWGRAIDRIDEANDKMGEKVDGIVSNLDPHLVGEVDRLNGEFWAHNLGTQRTTVARTVESGYELVKEMRNDRTLNLRNYYVTFGQKYRHDPHPVVLDGVRPHPDGWVLIRCGNQTAADRLAHALFGPRFSLVYSEETFTRSYYPQGALFSIKIEEDR